MENIEEYEQEERRESLPDKEALKLYYETRPEAKARFYLHDLHPEEAKENLGFEKQSFGRSRESKKDEYDFSDIIEFL